MNVVFLLVGLWDPSREKTLERLEEQVSRQTSQVDLWGQKRCATSVWSALENKEQSNDGEFEIVFDALQESSLPDRCLVVGFRDGAQKRYASARNMLVAEPPAHLLSEQSEPGESSESEELSPSQSQEKASTELSDPADQVEYMAQLEDKLRALGQENRSLRGDLTSREVLVRDLVHRLEKPRPAALDTGESSSANLVRARDAALERALDAEATCAELRFNVDELRLALSQLEALQTKEISSEQLSLSEFPSAQPREIELRDAQIRNARSRFEGLRARARDHERSSLLLQQENARLNLEVEGLRKELERVREQSMEREERAEGWRLDLLRAHEEVVRLRNSERDAAVKLEEAGQALEELSMQVQAEAKADAGLNGDEASREALGNLKRLLLQLTRNY